MQFQMIPALEPREAEKFEEFWKAYPRRIAKGEARRAWLQTRQIRPAMEVLLVALSAAKLSEQWQRDQGQFIPHPSTWLRGERWADCHQVEITSENSFEALINAKH